MAKILFNYHSKEALAAAIKQQDMITWILYKGDIDWGTFQDGYPDLLIRNAQNIRGNDVYFLADFDNPSTIFEQLAVLYALPHYGARTLTVYLPYFPTATMERVSIHGEIATAKTLMRMLDAIPHCHGGGPARLVIFDIHALSVQHFHGDGIIVDLHTALPLLLETLKKSGEEHVFAFPDDGAFKRFRAYFKNPVIVCSKVRDGCQVRVTIKDGADLVAGRHVVIIDDMVRGGDTILKCASLLESTGASKISAYATHGIFPEQSWRRIVDSPLSNFWVTDSCPTAERLRSEKPFKVLSLSTLIMHDIVSQEGL